MPRIAHVAASVALLSLALLAPAQAGTHATVVVQAGAPHYQPVAPMLVQYQAPPPARYEPIPRPRRGMVWVPGHWEWRGHRHAWIQGHWMRARPGHRYHEPRWEERNGRWYMHPGGWDRDGDGRPNQYDRYPGDTQR